MLSASSAEFLPAPGRGRPKSVNSKPKRGRGRPPGRRNYFDDPRFDHDLDSDAYADVIPIKFFPDDLPRLYQDSFRWTPAELKSAVAHAHSLLGLN